MFAWWSSRQVWGWSGKASPHQTKGPGRMPGSHGKMAIMSYKQTNKSNNNNKKNQENGHPFKDLKMLAGKLMMMEGRGGGGTAHPPTHTHKKTLTSMKFQFGSRQLSMNTASLDKSFSIEDLCTYIFWRSPQFSFAPLVKTFQWLSKHQHQSKTLRLVDSGLPTGIFQCQI